MLPRSGVSLDGRDYLGCLKATWTNPYVDPGGVSCTFEEWVGHRVRTRPIEFPVNGHRCRITYVGIWHPDGTPPLPWHAEAAVGGREHDSWRLVAPTSCEATAFFACHADAESRPRSYRWRAA